MRINHDDYVGHIEHNIFLRSTVVWKMSQAQLADAKLILKISPIVGQNAPDVTVDVLKR